MVSSHEEIVLACPCSLLNTFLHYCNLQHLTDFIKNINSFTGSSFCVKTSTSFTLQTGQIVSKCKIRGVEDFFPPFKGGSLLVVILWKTLSILWNILLLFLLVFSPLPRRFWNWYIPIELWLNLGLTMKRDMLENLLISIHNFHRKSQLVEIWHVN